MSDLDDWDFAGDDDAKMTITAAVRYLLRGTTDGVRGDILQWDYHDGASSRAGRTI